MAKKNQILKGILRGIADYAKNQADMVKLKTQAAMVDSRMRENWLWKLQAEKQAREDEFNFMRQKQEEFNKQYGNGNIESPQMNINAEGRPVIKTPTTADKQFAIRLGWARIKQKEARGIPLNEMEERFKEMYPEETEFAGKGVWSKSGLTNLARNKLAGVLQTGYYVHPLTNQRLPIKTKEQAINFIKQAGYMNYEEDPEMIGIINKFPSEIETKKTSQKRGWFLGGQKTTKSAEQRFNELVTGGITEDEAYRQLIKEGY